VITKACFLIGSQYVRHDVASDQVDFGMGAIQEDHVGEPTSCTLQTI
jgi:hypothetical protein